MLFAKLLALYEGRGFKVRTSLSPFLFHLPSISPLDWKTDPFFTYIEADGQISEGGGIHLTELVFLEGLCAALKPRRIFAVGVSYGWSSLALALANPDAKVVAIDLAGHPSTRLGLDLTRRIAT